MLPEGPKEVNNMFLNSNHRINFSTGSDVILKKSLELPPVYLLCLFYLFVALIALIKILPYSLLFTSVVLCDLALRTFDAAED